MAVRTAIRKLAEGEGNLFLRLRRLGRWAGRHQPPVDPGFSHSVITSVVDRARKFLASEVGIEVTQVKSASSTIDRLQLRELTAIIGIGGDIGLLVAFSFPRNFVDALYHRLTAGLRVPPGEEAIYRRSTATEVANIIIGHCTEDLSANGEHVALSPPVLIEGTKYVRRAEDSALNSVSLVTAYGSFDINVIGPPQKYSARLDSLIEG